MPKRIWTAVSIIVLLLTVMPVHAVWHHSIPALWPAAQENLCWCGATLAQGWIKALTGQLYSQHQLAPLDAKICVVERFSLGGMNAGELADIMNKYAGYKAEYNRVFFYRNSRTRQDAEAALIDAIRDQRQIALASNTVGANGDIRPGGHWMNVFAADIIEDRVWHIRVHDPLYSSKWQSSYQSLSLASRLPRDDWTESNGATQRGFESRWSGFADGEWQYVTYMYIKKPEATTQLPQLTPIPPDAKPFALGMLIQTTDALNLRKHPGLTDEILATAPLGELGVILEQKPVSADGFVWWPVVIMGQVGYMSQHRLEPYQPPPEVAPQAPIVSVSAGSTADTLVLEATTASLQSASPPPPTASGSIRISIVPPEAATAGARWRLANEDGWRESGTIAHHLLPGEYTVVFSDTPHWQTPGNQTVLLTQVGQEVWLNSPPYVALPGAPPSDTPPTDTAPSGKGTGSITVTLTAPAAIPAGAGWSINLLTDSMWRLTSGSVSALPAGTYVIMCGFVPGWRVVEHQEVTLGVGDHALVACAYTPRGPTDPAWIHIPHAPLPEANAVTHQRYSITASRLIAPSATVALETPADVAFDCSGNLYVPDRDRFSVYKFSLDGTLRAVYGEGYEGDGEHELDDPSGVAVDCAGNILYITDEENQRIKLHDLTTGAVTHIFGSEGTAKGQFLQPRGVAVDPRRNRLFIIDVGGNSLDEFHLNGAYVTSVGGGTLDFFDTPTHIAADCDGNRYVADTGNHRIVKMNPEDHPLLAIGRRGANPGEFISPQGVAVDCDRQWLLVADSGNRRIQGFRLADGTFLFAFDAAGSHTFQFPIGIDVDVSGVIAVADVAASRVVLFEIGDGSETGTPVLEQLDNAMTPTAEPAPPAVPSLACIPNGRSNSVMLFDTETRTKLDEIKVGRLPLSCVVLPDGSRAYAVNREDSTISVVRIRPEGLSIITTMTAGSDPYGAALSTDGRLLYVADTAPSKLLVFDTTTQTLLHSIPVGLEPTAVAVGSQYVYTSNDGSVTVIDAHTHTKVATIPLAGRLGEILLSPDESLLYMATPSNRVAVVRTSDHQVARVIGLAGRPSGLALTEDSSRLAVVLHDQHQLVFVDLATDTVVAEVPVGRNPIGAALAPDGTIWVLNSGSSTVSVVDPARLEVVATLPVGSYPRATGRFIHWTRNTAPSPPTTTPQLPPPPTEEPPKVAEQASAPVPLPSPLPPEAGAASQETPSNAPPTAPPPEPAPLQGEDEAETPILKIRPANLAYTLVKEKTVEKSLNGIDLIAPWGVAALCDGEGHAFVDRDRHVLELSFANVEPVSYDLAPLDLDDIGGITAVCEEGNERLALSGEDAKKIYFFDLSAKKTGEFDFPGSPRGITYHQEVFYTINHAASSTLLRHKFDGTPLPAFTGPQDKGFGSLSGVAAGRTCEVIVASDSARKEVVLINPATGEVYRTIGKTGAGEALLSRPDAVAIDCIYELVYVLDGPPANKVKVYDLITGAFLTSFSLPGNVQPTGIAVVEVTGEVIVTSVVGKGKFVFKPEEPPKAVEQESVPAPSPALITPLAPAPQEPTPSRSAYVCVPNGRSNTVMIFDAETLEKLGTAPVGNLALSCVVHPDGTFYVVNREDGTVTVLGFFDSALRPITTIAVGGEPYGAAVSPDGRRVYVAETAGWRVAVIDTATNTVMRYIAVGHEPIGVAVSRDGTRLYVTNGDEGTLSVVDTTTYAVIATIPLGERPGEVVVHPDGTRILVAVTKEQRITVIHATTHQVVDVIAVGGAPTGFAVTPDGSTLFVVLNEQNRVAVIDLATRATVKTIPVGTSPIGVGMSPDGTTAYVLNAGSDSVSIIDTALLEVIETIPVGDYPRAIGLFVGP